MKKPTEGECTIPERVCALIEELCEIDMSRVALLTPIAGTLEAVKAEIAAAEAVLGDTPRPTVSSTGLDPPPAGEARGRIAAAGAHDQMAKLNARLAATEPAGPDLSAARNGPVDPGLSAPTAELPAVISREDAPMDEDQALGRAFAGQGGNSAAASVFGALVVAGRASDKEILGALKQWRTFRFGAQSHRPGISWGTVGGDNPKFSWTTAREMNWPQGHGEGVRRSAGINLPANRWFSA